MNRVNGGQILHSVGNMQPIIYRPTHNDAEYCMEVARYRDKINRDLEWEKSKNQNFTILNHFVGAYGERAASKIFGIEWDGAKLDMLDYQEWRKVKPDLGIFEIKTINFPSGCLRLTENDKDWATATLMLAQDSWRLGCAILNGSKRPPLQPVCLVGHIPVKIGKSIGIPTIQSNHSTGTQKIKYSIDRKNLREPEELNKAIQLFNKVRKDRETMRMNGTEFRLTKWTR